MKPLLAGILSVILIGVAVTLVLLLTNTDHQHVATNKNEALVVLQDLSNTTTDDGAYQLFEQAFDVFDEDGNGYLTQTEFAVYLELEVIPFDQLMLFDLYSEYFFMFQKIDADDDDILSFREVVCYMNQMWQIQPVRDNMIRDISPIVSAVYNFKFAQMDTDDDGRLEKDEFFNMLYGVGGRSWKGQMMESYGDDYEQIMESVNAINITTDMVQDIELHLCSFESVSSDIVRSETRRLIYCYGPFYGIQCTHLGCQWVFHYLCI
eukprot:133398_1